MIRSLPRRLALICALIVVPAMAFGMVAQAKSNAASGINPADFTHRIDNPYMPLVPGTTYVYEGTSDGEEIHNEVVVTRQTKTILGVKCVVVRDTVIVDGVLTEETLDWYAQDKDGNVWYFGEDSKAYDEDGNVSTEGSWEAGVDGAQPGIIMEAHPRVGDVYQQEYYAGEAEDMAEVLSLSESVSVSYGSFNRVLLTAEWTPLEPGALEHKYYARGVGLILAVDVAGGSEQIELVSVEMPGHFKSKRR